MCSLQSTARHLNFPRQDCTSGNKVVLSLFWTILDLHKFNFFLEKKPQTLVTKLHNLSVHTALRDIIYCLLIAPALEHVIFGGDDAIE